MLICTTALNKKSFGESTFGNPTFSMPAFLEEIVIHINSKFDETGIRECGFHETILGRSSLSKTKFSEIKIGKSISGNPKR